MKQKVDSDLEPVDGERILYEAHPSMFRNHPIWYILTCLLCVSGILLPFLPIEVSWQTRFIEILVPLLIGLGVFFVWWLKIKGTTLTVTTERTSCRRGILSKAITEVWHRDIRNVQLNQSLLQRILNVGTIGISSAGQNEVEVNVSGIPDPESVKRFIDENRRREA